MNNYGKNQFVFTYKSADFGGAVRCKCQYSVVLLYDFDDGPVHRKQNIYLFLSILIFVLCWCLIEYLCITYMLSNVTIQDRKF